MKPIWGILMDAFFVAVLLWCSYTDLKSRTVSNLSVAMFLCLGLVNTVFVIISGSTWWVYPAGMLLGIPFFIAWIKGGMGGGDVKLIMGIGLYLGLTNTLVSFALMLPVLIVCMIRSWRKNGTIESAIPFAPVIALGAGGVLLVGHAEMILTYLFT